MSTTNTEQTTVQTVDMDGLEDLFAPNAGSAVIPETDKDKKPDFFAPQNPELDTSFTDPEEKEKEKEKEGEPEKEPTPEDAKKIIEGLDLDEDEEDGEQDPTAESSARGRKKTDKNALVSLLQKRIESDEFFPFDDFDETKQNLTEYLSGLGEKDLDELLTANIDAVRQSEREKTPKEFFESLPPQLQYAAKYVMDGGKDLPGLFSALGQVERTRALDETVEEDQVDINRQYLHAVGFGTDEEIEEELKIYADTGLLAKKAKQFKPKLDQMQEEVVAQRLAEQEEKQKQQQQMAENFVSSVFEALRGGEIKGLKLDKKTQDNLMRGMTEPRYTSVNGKPTNKLGHLLEKFQFVEPDLGLVSEALWLLEDREGYRQHLIKMGEQAATEKTVRALKTEQSRKSGGSSQEDDIKEAGAKRRTVPRANQNFFNR